jgi:hypothetical protein
MENKHIQKSLQECLWYCMVSPDHLSPAQATFSAMKTPENIEENRDDPEPTGERAQEVTKIACENLGQHRYHDNPEYLAPVWSCVIWTNKILW